jgi:hypothetical protein
LDSGGEQLHFIEITRKRCNLLQPTNAAPVTYRIRVQGALDNSQTARITGLQVDTEAGADAPVTTTLTGTLHDEAELAGVLDRLYALGLPLISVEREEPDQAAPAASREVDEPDQLT